jgi:hypothetical protein
MINRLINNLSGNYDLRLQTKREKKEELGADSGVLALAS